MSRQKPAITAIQQETSGRFNVLDRKAVYLALALFANGFAADMAAAEGKKSESTTAEVFKVSPTQGKEGSSAKIYLRKLAKKVARRQVTVEFWDTKGTIKEVSMIGSKRAVVTVEIPELGLFDGETRIVELIVSLDGNPLKVVGTNWKFTVQGVGSVCPEEMVFVPAGDFLMGGEEADNPLHTAATGAYCMDKYEMTNGKFSAIAQSDAFISAGGMPLDVLISQVGANGGKNGEKVGRYLDPDYAEHPVVNVSYEWQAVPACQAQGKRLPTETEWEKAARGTDGRAYPWGNEAPDASKANYGMQVGDTVPVGSYPAGVSPYGAHDLAGNVLELTSDKKNDAMIEKGGDWWNGSYDYYSEVTGYQGSKDDYFSYLLKSGARVFELPPRGYNDVTGFRCVKDVQGSSAQNIKRVLKNRIGEFKITKSGQKLLKFNGAYFSHF